MNNLTRDDWNIVHLGLERLAENAEHREGDTPLVQKYKAVLDRVTDLLELATAEKSAMGVSK